MVVVSLPLMRLLFRAMLTWPIRVEARLVQTLALNWSTLRAAPVFGVVLLVEPVLGAVQLQELPVLGAAGEVVAVAVGTEVAVAAAVAAVVGAAVAAALDEPVVLVVVAVEVTLVLAVGIGVDVAAGAVVAIGVEVAAAVELELLLVPPVLGAAQLLVLATGVDVATLPVLGAAQVQVPAELLLVPPVAGAAGVVVAAAVALVLGVVVHAEELVPPVLATVEDLAN